MNPPVLLLFCPEMGGWHTGVYWEGAWRLHADLDVVLEPTSWAICPPEPEEPVPEAPNVFRLNRHPAFHDPGEMR